MEVLTDISCNLMISFPVLALESEGHQIGRDWALDGGLNGAGSFPERFACATG